MIEVQGKNGIEVKVVADSEMNGDRITTLQLKYHRFIHSEFMTHRVFSRNASSSRAIPISKIIQQVVDEPAIPIEWGKNRPGMQAREVFENEDIILCEEMWLEARDLAVKCARKMAKFGLHKQIVNRILEPWQFINTVMTSTEWDNYFQLRLHEDAQPEIQELARCMMRAMTQSQPRNHPLHLPYVLEAGLDKDMAFACSTARCARVSFKNHDKSDPVIEKDVELHDTLLNSCHWSPFEHPAEYYGMGWQDNFYNWSSYRKKLKNAGRAR